jgi:mono/diheme cytochrome c family protein
MKAILALGTVLLVLAVSAPAGAAGDAAKGKELYARKCQACHAADGKGTPAMQKKYGDAWKAHGSPEVQAMTDDELIAAFRKATIHAPMAKSVSDADLADLVAHIRTLKP